MRHEGYPRIRLRLTLVGALFSTIAVVLLVRAIDLTLGAANHAQANLAVMTRKPHSLDLLSSQTMRINEMTAHMYEHSINEITGLLTETSHIADQAALELQAQSDAAAKIRADAAVDATVYLDTQRKLAATNRLQSEEIVRLNGVLNQALQPSWFASVGSYLLSFIGGVVAAILGDLVKKMVTTWWKRRRAKASDVESTVGETTLHD